MSSNVIHVQYCSNCDSHAWNTHHNQAKYSQTFIKLRNAIEQEFKENIPVIVANQVPSHYVPIKQQQNKYYNPVSKKYVFFPNIGSFEISYNGELVFSKKKLNTWPCFDTVLDQLSVLISSKERVKPKNLNNKNNKNILKENNNISQRSQSKVNQNSNQSQSLQREDQNDNDNENKNISQNYSMPRQINTVHSQKQKEPNNTDSQQKATPKKVDGFTLTDHFKSYHKNNHFGSNTTIKQNPADEIKRKYALNSQKSPNKDKQMNVDDMDELKRALSTKKYSSYQNSQSNFNDSSKDNNRNTEHKKQILINLSCIEQEQNPLNLRFLAADEDRRVSRNQQGSEKSLSRKRLEEWGMDLKKIQKQMKNIQHKVQVGGNNDSDKNSFEEQSNQQYDASSRRPCDSRGTHKKGSPPKQSKFSQQNRNSFLDFHKLNFGCPLQVPNDKATDRYDERYISPTYWEQSHLNVKKSKKLDEIQQYIQANQQQKTKKLKRIYGDWKMLNSGGSSHSHKSTNYRKKKYNNRGLPKQDIHSRQQQKLRHLQEEEDSSDTQVYTSKVVQIGRPQKQKLNQLVKTPYHNMSTVAHKTHMNQQKRDKNDNHNKNKAFTIKKTQKNSNPNSNSNSMHRNNNIFEHKKNSQSVKLKDLKGYSFSKQEQKDSEFSHKNNNNNRYSKHKEQHKEKQPLNSIENHHKSFKLQKATLQKKRFYNKKQNLDQLKRSQEIHQPTAIQLGQKQLKRSRNYVNKLQKKKQEEKQLSFHNNNYTTIRSISKASSKGGSTHKQENRFKKLSQKEQKDKSLSKPKQQQTQIFSVSKVNKTSKTHKKKPLTMDSPQSLGVKIGQVTISNKGKDQNKNKPFQINNLTVSESNTLQNTDKVPQQQKDNIQTQKKAQNKQLTNTQQQKNQQTNENNYQNIFLKKEENLDLKQTPLIHNKDQLNIQNNSQQQTAIIVQQKQINQQQLNIIVEKQLQFNNTQQQVQRQQGTPKINKLQQKSQRKSIKQNQQQETPLKNQNNQAPILNNKPINDNNNIIEQTPKKSAQDYSVINNYDLSPHKQSTHRLSHSPNQVHVIIDNSPGKQYSVVKTKKLGSNHEENQEKGSKSQIQSLPKSVSVQSDRYAVKKSQKRKGKGKNSRSKANKSQFAKTSKPSKFCQFSQSSVDESNQTEQVFEHKQIAVKVQSVNHLSENQNIEIENKSKNHLQTPKRNSVMSNRSNADNISNGGLNRSKRTSKSSIQPFSKRITDENTRKVKQWRNSSIDSKSIQNNEKSVNQSKMSKSMRTSQVSKADSHKKEQSMSKSMMASGKSNNVLQQQKPKSKVVSKVQNNGIQSDYNQTKDNKTKSIIERNTKSKSQMPQANSMKGKSVKSIRSKRNSQKSMRRNLQVEKIYSNAVRNRNSRIISERPSKSIIDQNKMSYFAQQQNSQGSQNSIDNNNSSSNNSSNTQNNSIIQYKRSVAQIRKQIYSMGEQILEQCQKYQEKVEQGFIYKTNLINDNNTEEEDFCIQPECLIQNKQSFKLSTSAKQHIEYRSIEQLYSDEAQLFGQSSIQSHLMKLNSNQFSLVNLHKVIHILSERNELLIVRLFEDYQPYCSLQKEKEHKGHKNGVTRKHYGVWLCIDHQWKCIIVNNIIPTLRDNQNNLTAICTSHEGNQTWPIILEKAAVIAVGGYAQLSSLTVGEIFQMLTGSNYGSYLINQQVSKNKQFLKNVQESQKKNFIMTCERYPNNLKQQKQLQEQVKIYYLMSKKTVNNGQQLLFKIKQVFPKNINGGLQLEPYYVKFEKFCETFKSCEILHLRQHQNYCFFPLIGMKDISQRQIKSSKKYENMSSKQSNEKKKFFSVVQLSFAEVSFGTISVYNRQKGDLRAYLYKLEHSDRQIMKLVGQASKTNKKQLFFDCYFQQQKYYLFIQTERPGTVLSFMGDGRPDIKVKEEIAQTGLRNNNIQYVPVSNYDGFETINSMNRTNNSNFSAGIGQFKESNIDQLRQMFVNLMLQEKKARN